LVQAVRPKRTRIQPRLYATEKGASAPFFIARRNIRSFEVGTSEDAVQHKSDTLRPLMYTGG